MAVFLYVILVTRLLLFAQKFLNYTSIPNQQSDFDQDVFMKFHSGSSLTKRIYLPHIIWRNSTWNQSATFWESSWHWRNSNRDDSQSWKHNIAYSTDWTIQQDLDREESSAGLQGRSFRSYLQYNTTPNGDRSCCDNYHRSITVLSLAGKALARVLLNRLYDHLLASDHLESQCGFRAGRGKINMIFIIHHPLRRYRGRRIAESNTWTSISIMIFIDLTKASDSIDRDDALWHIMHRIGCPTNFVNTVRSFHDETYTVCMKCQRCPFLSAAKWRLSISCFARDISNAVTKCCTVPKPESEFRGCNHKLIYVFWPKFATSRISNCANEKKTENSPGWKVCPF